MKLVLQKLNNARLYTKLKNFIFYKSKVEFFGCIISNEDLLMNQKNVQVVKDSKIPKIV